SLISSSPGGHGPAPKKSSRIQIERHAIFSGDGMQFFGSLPHHPAVAKHHVAQAINVQSIRNQIGIGGLARSGQQLLASPKCRRWIAENCQNAEKQVGGALGEKGIIAPIGTSTEKLNRAFKVLRGCRELSGKGQNSTQYEVRSCERR